MKLGKLLLVGFASMALAGCEFPWSKKDSGGGDQKKEYRLNPTITGGSDEETTAILEVLNTKPICEKFGKSTNEIFDDGNPILKEDEGDNIRLTNAYTYKGKKVEFTWNVPTGQPYFKKILQPETDEDHQFIEVNYLGYAHKEEMGTLTWNISKIKCGSAVAESPDVTYQCRFQNETILHTSTTIDELLAFHTNEKVVTVDDVDYKWPSTYDLIDYDQVDGDGKPNPYFIQSDVDNPDAGYYYTNVKGKVIYLAPDGKFGLIGDGESVLQIYAGSGTALLESNYPYLGVGKYVTVSGNMSQYCGNVQLGYVTKIQPADASEVTDPSGTYNQLSAAEIQTFETYADHAQIQAVEVDGVIMANSLRKVTGTVKSGTLKVCTGKAENKDDWKAADSLADKGKRYMFDIEVSDGTGVDDPKATFTVYYDKHVAVGAGASVFNNLKTAYASGSVTVEGFATYFGQDKNPFVLYQNLSPLGSLGHWTIVPLK